MENNQNGPRAYELQNRPVQRRTNSQNSTQRPVQRPANSQTGAQRPTQRPVAAQNRPSVARQRTLIQQSQPADRNSRPNNQTHNRTTETGHKLPQTQYARVSTSKSPNQINTDRVTEIRSKRDGGNSPKKPSRALITLTTLLLAGLLTIALITANSQTNDQAQSDTTPEASISQTDPTYKTQQQNIAPESSHSKEEKIYELDEIDPTYEFITWKGKQQLTIDDDSMKEIVKLALRDAVDFYYNLDAPNCSFVLNEQGKVVNTKGKKNFIEKQMSWQYYMGRIYQEASGYIMVDFVNDIGKGANNPNGIFGSMPISTNNTLDEYFKLYFNHDPKFAELDSVLTKQDVANVNSSKKANDLITQKVYNATLKVIIDDIHKLKSMTIGHSECYLPYKDMTVNQIMTMYNIDPSLKDEVQDIVNELKSFNGQYSPTLALSALQATHLYGFTDVRSSMSDGSFFAKYFKTEYILKTFANTDKIEESGLLYQ